MVHRKDGTYDGNVSFRPLVGIVQKGGVTDGAYQYVFAPLRGSYYHMLSMPSANCVFAPLRGLYLFFSDYGWNSVVFVPLRGLYIQCIVVRLRKGVFAPLRGLYRYFEDWAEMLEVFAPLRGSYPKYITKHRKTEEPEWLENIHFITMMCFCAEKNRHKFVWPALCAGQFHDMMQIMDLIKRSVALC